MAAFASSLTLLLLPLIFLSVVAVVVSVAADHDDHSGLTHIHLYVHETFTGANKTNAIVLQSPLGGNSSFGMMGVVDDEMRVGLDPSSQLVGRYQAVFFGTGLDEGGGGVGYLSSIELVFTAGEYAGSTLAMQGHVHDFSGTIERAVVGGTGRFRMAQGYMLFKMISMPTPETDINDINLFVRMPRRPHNHAK